jgi:hypothetical protein
MNEVKRPSLREAARRGAEANRQAKEAAPPTKPPPAPAKPAEVVTASCGHEITVEPGGKPAFLAERLKKLAGQPCPECKRKAQQEREAAGQEAARLRRAEKAAREPRPKPRLGRLPHGAAFHVVYDAEAVKWGGTLIVPQGGIYNASVTTGEDSAVFALLMQLDRSYRGVTAEEAAPTE